MFVAQASAFPAIALLAALLAGCMTQRQYQNMAISSFASEECRSLQSVIEEREQYGIVAPSHDLDLEALRQCNLPYSYGGGPPAGSAPPSATIVVQGASEVVPLERWRGVFAVLVVINQAIAIPFVLDSASADMQLPAEVVLTLIRTGALAETDFLGTSSYVLADGTKLRSPSFNLREM
jgi:hypothetical protein